MENLELLIDTLRRNESETNWLEFKYNNYNPDMIGEDISALANGATFAEKNCAYMVWGVHDKTHEIVGTEFDQYNLNIGNQEFESWLRNLLSSNAEVDFQTVYINNKRVVLLTIHKATGNTVKFKNIEYIRVGSYTKKLNEYPQMQAQLWDKLRNNRFEEQYAKTDLTAESVLQLIDCSAYFDIKNDPVPTSINGMMHYLKEEGIVVQQDNGLYAITNLGAILFARSLDFFSRLKRKAIRVVQYQGKNKINMLKETVEDKGYAVGFSNLLKYVEAVLPSQEIIVGVKREKVLPYPPEALREAIANALIHQDFSITGTGIVIEIFDDRLEITNPGAPLVDIERIVDNPPKSRNENLAALMRRLGMCEELGTGWDKIIIYCEVQQIPAPHIYRYEESTKVTFFLKRDFFDLSHDDKIWTCYMHACIKYIQGEFLTNSSLRERFGLETKSSASISRLIKDANNSNFIKKLEDTAPKHTKYVPFWA